MYSAYVPQLVFALIFMVLFLVCSILQSCPKTNASRIAYNIMIIICVAMDICLLFSTTMGVGASGYDDGAKNCYLLE